MRYTSKLFLEIKIIKDVYTHRLHYICCVNCYLIGITTGGVLLVGLQRIKYYRAMRFFRMVLCAVLLYIQH